MDDGNVYETLPMEYKVFARGLPKPAAKWTFNGEPIKSSQRVKISEDDGCYKLHILQSEMSDAGAYQCEISNKLGKIARKATLSVTC